MVNLTIKLYELWKNRLSQDYPQEHTSIITWLMGCPDIQNPLSSSEMTQLMSYRYETLKNRYLNTSSKQGYSRLVCRLSAIIIKYPPIEKKIGDNPQYQSLILNLTQQILENMITQDPEVQKILNWIKECTPNSRLREVFVLASLEEYCCQLVHCKPRILGDLGHLLEIQTVLVA